MGNNSVNIKFSRHRFKAFSLKTALFGVTVCGFFTSIIILNYISQLSNYYPRHHHYHYHQVDSRLLKVSGASAVTVSGERYLNWPNVTAAEKGGSFGGGLPTDQEVNVTRPAKPAWNSVYNNLSAIIIGDGSKIKSQDRAAMVDHLVQVQQGEIADSKNVFHDEELFMEDYKEMNRTLKIFVYPHQPDDPFTNVFSRPKSDPSGNYASESYFKKSLFKSHFITKNPAKAHLFYLPFSIATLRNDKRVGVGGIPKFIRGYISNISKTYPYWNRTGGADHFYVACHSVGRSAMEKAEQVKLNAIQVVCSSSYFLPGYIPHKDVSVPQIWPRTKDPDPTALSTQSIRNKLAFYAGAMNSRERKSLVKIWGNDSDLSIHATRLKTPYSEALLGSKFCIHAKGFEVNTARVTDAIYYGCVPVIMADYYDLPFVDVLNWKSFSVVVSSMDVLLLKKILQEEISNENYMEMQRNVVRVRKHFQWHGVPVDFDVFHMVMYELWIRRSNLRLATGSV